LIGKTKQSLQSSPPESLLQTTTTGQELCRSFCGIALREQVPECQPSKNTPDKSDILSIKGILIYIFVHFLRKKFGG
jgi:hypothetical protein